jgi:hypothetical protein
MGVLVLLGLQETAAFVGPGFEAARIELALRLGFGRARRRRFFLALLLLRFGLALGFAVILARPELGKVCNTM